MNWADLIMPTTTACNRPQTDGGGSEWWGGPWDPERLTISGAAGNKRARLWHPRFTRNLTHNNRVYEVGRSHGGLTECSELLFLNGHLFVLSLFPTRCTAFSTARRVIRLLRQQVLRPAWGRGIGTWVHSSWAGAGQLGVRLTGGPVLVLHVLR